MAIAAAPEPKALPGNAYTPLAPGETYKPPIPAGAAVPELTARSVGWGLFLCVVFTVASAYSGLKVGQVMEAAIPISILAIGLARALSAPLHPARERHHHRHRRTGRLDRGGRHLHPARALHPQARSAPRPDHLHLPGRRLPGRAVPDSPAPLLRARHARPASLPRGHRHHRSAGHRREGRLAGETAAAGHRHRGRLRFPRHHLPRLERVPRFSVPRPSCARSPTAPGWRSASTPSASSSDWAT